MVAPNRTSNPSSPATLWELVLLLDGPAGNRLTVLMFAWTASERHAPDIDRAHRFSGLGGRLVWGLGAPFDAARAAKRPPVTVTLLQPQDQREAR